MINKFVITPLLKIKNNKNNVYVKSFIFSNFCTSVDFFFFNVSLSRSLGTWFPKFQKEALPSCSLTVGSTRIYHTSHEDDNTCLRNAEDYLINDAASYFRRPESTDTRLWIAPTSQLLRCCDVYFIKHRTVNDMTCLKYKGTYLQGQEMTETWAGESKCSYACVPQGKCLNRPKYKTKWHSECE